LESIIDNHQDDFYLLKNSPFQWAKVILTETDNTTAFFVNSIHKKDLMHRAKLLLLGAINKGYRDLVYMDGHGRLTACLLDTIHNYEWENHFDNLFCVETDHAMDKWHQLFFPDVIECVHSDIFYFLDNYPGKNKPFVYFNFCGLGQDVYFVLDFLIEMPNVMISFSKRCSCKENRICVKCKSGIYDYCQKHAIVKYQNKHNKNFHTFLFQ
jgi:hypothetical protein